jgi:probable HAF family extracellular repeat protein
MAARCWTLALALLLLAPGAAARAQQVVAIESMPGFEAPQVYALSRDGSVAAGTAVGGVGGSGNGFIWSDGAFVAVPPVLPGRQSWVFDLSADGTVAVGRSGLTSIWRPTRWSAATGTVSLDTPVFGLSAYSYAVSADGSVIVGVYNSSGTFRWREGAGVDYPGLGSSANGISDDGSVVVGTLGDPDFYEAYRWTEVTGAMPLGALSSSEGSIGTDVSADGQIAVGSSGERAFRWTQAEGMVDIGTLPGCRSVATSVSANGKLIAGVCTNEVPAFALRGFVWTPNTGLLSVEDFLLLHGISLGEPTPYVYNVTVSDDGHVLAVNLADRSLLITLAQEVGALPLAASAWLAAALVLTGSRLAARRR